MSSVWNGIDGVVNWIAANARSFSYLLPDSLELALYLGIAAYFAVQLAQQQV
jgi:hypothetical protein